MTHLRTFFLLAALTTAAIPAAQAASQEHMEVTTEAAVATDTRAARLLRAFKRDGYQEISRTYSQIYYLVAPTEDYRWGEAQIVLRKSSDNYSLTTYYATVHVDIMADIETGRYYAGRVWSEESVVR
ncbi:MAG: hypothetical protein HYV16_11070 [Gammaproteobacteria bacterium]|nr:hypothetical protein [Gammaproteobacteria bacterium]